MDFRKTGWCRIVDINGATWCETSIESEARASMRPGDTLWYLYEKIERKWVRGEYMKLTKENDADKNT